MGRPFPPQNCPFPWGIWTPSNTWFPGPTRVLNPNGIWISSVVFAGLTSVTDWRSVTLICGALEEHLLSYLLTYLLTYIQTTLLGR